jgi:hypothetical protein
MILPGLCLETLSSANAALLDGHIEGLLKGAGCHISQRLEGLEKVVVVVAEAALTGDFLDGLPHLQAVRGGVDAHLQQLLMDTDLEFFAKNTFKVRVAVPQTP